MKSLYYQRLMLYGYRRRKLLMNLACTRRCRWRNRRHLNRFFVIIQTFYCVIDVIIVDFFNFSLSSFRCGLDATTLVCSLEVDTLGVWDGGQKYWQFLATNHQAIIVHLSQTKCALNKTLFKKISLEKKIFSFSMTVISSTIIGISINKAVIACP